MVERIEEMKALLLKLKEETLKEINKSMKSSSEHPSGEPSGDIYDQASNERDRELGLLLSDREREKLRNINDALLRIEEGEYGICEECGCDIPLGRLKVMPFAHYCVKCKEDLERFQAQTKRFEEERTYGEIPMNEEDDM
ncbi:MAG TPA: TraR/DksA family transcriptional regulator [Geobacteraceae bacterium]|nr:TraR/DksA family transcriptional regulator [Geobacteraceae bacterium]